MGARNAVFACFVATLVFLSYLYAIVTAEGWPTQRVLSSVVRIRVEFDGQPGTCSAFSVDQAQGRFITAAHCATGSVSLGTIPLEVIDRDAVADIALLQAREGGLPALSLGGTPHAGDATLSVGYPMQSTHPMLIPSLYQGTFDPWATGLIVAVFSGNSMPGMSGGPIVNTRGDVISVVLGGGHPSREFQNVGFGTTYKALRRMLVKWQTGGERLTSSS